MRVLIRPLIALVLAWATLVPAGATDDLPRLLMISIDGLMPSRYLTSGPAKIPTLRRLMTRGIHADGVVGVMPTVTYPSHTTLITGVPPAVHGILDNRIVDPGERSNIAWYWYAQDIKVPTLPLAARARGLRAAAIAWPVTLGMDLDYVVPEFWRSGSDHPDDRKLIEALSHPRDLIDLAEQAQARPFAWPTADRERTDIARFVIRTYKPHALLVHLIDLDSSEHDNGPDAAESLETLERIDSYVAALLDELASAGLSDRTNVVVVSDHGFLATSQRLQPNAALKEAGLLTVDERGRIAEWQAYFHSSGGSGFIYLKDPNDAALRDRVHALLRTLQSDPANGIRQIWTRTELDTFGAHPGASFGLDVVDGFYTGGGHDRLVGPSSGKGGHGFAPTRPALHSSFIAAGPAITRRGSIGTIRMTQVAPTLARILGVGLSPQADEPFAVTK